MKKLALPTRFGWLIGMGLITYFIILSTFNLHTKPIFSLLNGAIVGYGLSRMFKRYAISKTKNHKIKYYKGFSLGFLTGLNATIIFTLFFVLFSTEIQPTFLDELVGNWRSHYHTPSGLVYFVVFIMGVSTSMVFTLFYMQYYKVSWNLKHLISNPEEKLVTN